MKKLLVLVLAILIAVPSFAGMAVEESVAIKAVEENATYLQIANEDKLVEMLIASGDIASDASPEDIQKTLKSFLESKSKQFDEPGELKAYEDKRAASQLDKVQNFGLTNGNGKKVGQKVKNINGVEIDTFAGEVTEDRILAILINFPDYDGNTLTEEHTEMLYDEYTKEHYQDLLFGDSYEGPNGEEFISMKAYYEAQSGGAYTVTGGVAGWYTAANPAAYYGGNNANDNDSAARLLAYEALRQAAADPSIDLTWYDQEDRYDLDGDGNLREPDGLVDHVMVFHASVGEEAGGGELGDDAIWSHRWNLGGVYGLGVASNSVEWGGEMAAYDYTMQPIDAAAGVCAHEYGHDLGLADEYDTIYSGSGEPVSYWSIMSSGSWAGAIGGTQPTGFSPYAKEFFAATINPRWFEAAEVNYADLDAGSTKLYLDAAATKGTNLDAVKIILPNSIVKVIDGYDADGFYYSTSGDEILTQMATTIDLTTATTAMLNFKTYFLIETDWDYGFIYVIDANGDEHPLNGNLSVETDPNGNNPGYGITGYTDAWIDGEYSLDAFAGQEITLVFGYDTDEAFKEYGFCVDEIVVTTDAGVILNDSTQEAFDLYGFEIGDGTTESSRYYLVEWRDHSGVDAGLGNLKRGDSFMSFDPGMVVWYVDNSFEDNHVGNHPGQGYVGVVDASQKLLKWDDGSVASTKYQIHDAAFNVSKSEKMLLDYSALGLDFKYLVDNQTAPTPLFSDGNSYIDFKQPDSGKLLPNLGLKIRVLGESDDQSVGLIEIFK